MWNQCSKTVQPYKIKLYFCFFSILLELPYQPFLCQNYRTINSAYFESSKSIYTHPLKPRSIYPLFFLWAPPFLRDDLQLSRVSKSNSLFHTLLPTIKELLYWRRQPLHDVGCDISAFNEIIFGVSLPNHFFILFTELSAILFAVESIIDTVALHPCYLLFFLIL